MRLRTILTPAATLAALLMPIATAAGDSAGSATTIATAEHATALLPIKNARIPITGVLSGGQPTPEQIEDAARAGFHTVINLRTDEEPGFEWERETVEGLGMRYVQIPVTGASGLTRENVERIDAALSEALEAGSVLLHCGSGNRIGAVLALREAWLRDADAGAALDHGLASGLTKLEPATRELLGLTESVAETAKSK